MSNSTYNINIGSSKYYADTNLRILNLLEQAESLIIAFVKFLAKVGEEDRKMYFR
jgi:hypothetical protein